MAQGREPDAVLPEPVVPVLAQRGWAVGDGPAWRARVRAECRAAGLRVTTNKRMFGLDGIPFDVAVARDRVPDYETAMAFALRTGQHWCSQWTLGTPRDRVYGPIIWYPAAFRFCPLCGLPIPTQEEVRAHVRQEFPDAWAIPDNPF